ncbi:DNA primase family protein [Psychrobacillus sp. BM2]|uniref:DNA primase family protein n=1 Tax=Psychrobacillus sp. BM2 TaxID=3400421 RepID=UPI003B01BDFD
MTTNKKHSTKQKYKNNFSDLKNISPITESENSLGNLKSSQSNKNDIYEYFKSSTLKQTITEPTLEDEFIKQQDCYSEINRFDLSSLTLSTNLNYSSLDSVSSNDEEKETLTSLTPPQKYTFRVTRPGDTKNTSSDIKFTNQNKKSSFNRAQKQETTKPNNFTIAKLLMNKFKFIKIYETLYYWDIEKSHYTSFYGKSANMFIRRNVPAAFKGNINKSNIHEILQWIDSLIENPISENALFKRKSFVAFKNGIVEIEDFTIHKHHPKFFFTSVLNASYPITNNPNGKYFERFINQITGDNEAIYLRLQELFGYVISEIREVKILPFLLGPKDSGKSIILKILEHIIGKDFFTNLSLEQLNKQEYLSLLLGKKLNTCGEVSEISLTRLDTLKKLSGGDYVMGKQLYEDPVNFINSAVLLFAGNHLPKIKNLDHSKAFSQRLLIFPFNHPVAKDKQDKNLFEKLKKETSYIVQWSMIGLNRLVQNNYQFTTSEELEIILTDYNNETNSIDSFINSCCIIEPSARIHNSTLYPAYENYCYETDKTPKSYNYFTEHLKSLKFIKSRIRIKEDNKNGFYGIKLIEELENEEIAGQ